MGTVVQFKQGISKQADAQPASKIGDHLSTLVENLKAIESCRSVIDKDVQVIQSIVRSTQDRELRAHLLGQLKSMHDQMLQLSLILRSTKLSIEESVGIVAE
jgi:hypothetical protein